MTIRPPALLLLALLAAGCSPAQDGTPAAAVTPTAEPLSPFAAEVRWTTSSSSASPVVFFEQGTSNETLVTGAGAATTDHRVLLQSLASSTTYEYRVGDGTAFTGAGTFTTPAAPSGTFRVLFDNAHAEQAGNADWVIDDDWPQPSPAAPASEASWSGAYSAWGFELFATGRYDVETFPPGSAFTLGALSAYDAVVLPEPNSDFTAAEVTALRDYVAAGGGLFLIADHEGSDRDSDGWESWEAFNLLPDADPSLGFRFDAVSIGTLSPTSEFVVDAREPLLHGPFGDVAAMGFHGTNSLRYFPQANPRMRPILWRPNASGSTTALLVAAGFFGDGKIVLIGDSSPADDGTANPGNANIFDSWSEPLEDNDTFFLNATAWLVDDAGN